MISLCGGTKTITDPAVDLGIESIITLIGLHTHFCSKRIGRLHEWPALHVLHQADHVAVDSTGKAMVALSVLIKFQTRSLLVMAIETIGLSSLLFTSSMKFVKSCRSSFLAPTGLTFELTILLPLVDSLICGKLRRKANASRFFFEAGYYESSPFHHSLVTSSSLK